MKFYSTALLMASTTMVMASCFSKQVPPADNSSSEAGSGDETPTPPPPAPVSAGQQEFVKNVYEALKTPCATCHTSGTFDAPTFMVGTPQEVYQIFKTYHNGALAAPLDQNLLLTRGPHEGPALSPEQRGAVKTWLSKEHPNDNSNEPQDIYSTFDAFVQCLDFEDFKLRGYDQLFNQPTSDNKGTCEDCHADADKAGGLLLINNAQAVFDQFKTFPAIMKLVTPTVTASGSIGKIVRSDRIIDRGQDYTEKGCTFDQGLQFIDDLNNPDYCHPTYNFGEQFENNLEKFVDNMITNFEAGGERCTPQGM